MRSRLRVPENVPLVLLKVGTALLVVTVIIGLVGLPRPRTHAARAAPPLANPTRAATTTAPPPPATPAPVSLSWRSAGGLIVHTDQLDPTLAGELARANGFGWVAVQIADGETQTPLVANWISRFRAASGLPVGGWSVLRGNPDAEARLAATLLVQNQLDFYIADAEQEYGLTNGVQQSVAHAHRSSEFITAFRALEPAMPAALSSFCRADEHDVDWGAWSAAGFAFLPQAYVDQLGPDGTPAECVTAAERWFPPSSIHPALGIFTGPYPTPAPTDYAALLAEAGTTGFSLFPFENADSATLAAYGNAIRTATIAQPAP